MSEGNNRYQYNYSAKEHEEIQKIREKYIPREETKLDQLRRLDAEASKPGIIVSIIVGVIGFVLFALGMCCALEWMGSLFIPGIIIGAIGLACMGLACPLYYRITNKQREKIAPEILRLTEDLSKE